MLYDDSEQIELRYVISLAHHDVSIYGGGGQIPEGELWIKRNAICLTRRQDSIADLHGTTQPFYLFSENLSEKEDFYFAMLRSQERIPDSPNCPPKHQGYDSKHIIALIQRLHSSQEQLQTQWVNAILGRLFLAMYKTPQMEQFVREKITKKISRIKKPNFITKITLQKIDVGEGVPFITNPRLKKLTLNGDCSVEADVNYNGNFRLEVSATARIDLGTRFKVREVDILLSVVLKKLEGHCLVRLKPPPSNRIWFSFETMPDMVMAIEPIVSSMQITYGVILRAIESRIREALAETLVLPFWDDIPFFDTSSQSFRGGIWQQEIPQQDCETEVPDESEVQDKATLATEQNSVELVPARDGPTMGTPVCLSSPPAILRSRNSSKSSILKSRPDENAISSTTEKMGSSSPPRTIRSQTLSQAADPVVTAGHVNKVTYDSKNSERKDATSSMLDLPSRSPPILLADTPITSQTEGLAVPISTLQSSDLASTGPADSGGSRESSPEVPQSPFCDSPGLDFGISKNVEHSSGTSLASQGSGRRSSLGNVTPPLDFSRSPEEKLQRTGSIGSATTVVKKWGWNMLRKKNQTEGKGLDSAGQSSIPNHAIGCGHPVGPIRPPLTPPERCNFRSNPVSIQNLKPVPSPLPPECAKGERERPKSRPLFPMRKSVSAGEQEENSGDELLVAEASHDPEPNSYVPTVTGFAKCTEMWEDSHASSKGSKDQNPDKNQLQSESVFYRASKHSKDAL